MTTRNETILLIEDDADDAEMTMYALAKANFTNLHHLDDGETALQYLFAPDTVLPAIILLDLMMPKVDGIEILSRLKSDSKRKHIPVLALISSKEGRRYVESFKIAPDGYLTKPVSGKSFLSVLAEIGLSHLVHAPSR